MNEEKPKYHTERFVRKGTMVTCAICHSARGTMRKDPQNGNWLCELCYGHVMEQRYKGKWKG